MKVITLLIGLFVTNLGYSQVAKKTMLEHFTNTKCSICGSRNPGLISNLDNNKDVIHISIHPSKPYSTCVLNNHNSNLNDDRTKFYGIFGSTPQIVVNGNHLGNVSFTKTDLFDPYKNQLSEVSLNSNIAYLSGDSLEVSVELLTEASHSYTTEKITVVLVEDTVFYNAPNGEKLHYNVLRKSLTDITGDDITISTAINNKQTLSFKSDFHPDWNKERIRAVVILQKLSDKGLIQSDETLVLGSRFGTSVANLKNDLDDWTLYPNPTNTRITIYGKGVSSFSVLDITGKVLINAEVFKESMVDVSHLNRGIYFVKINGNNQSKTVRLIKD